jgi:hypothetical protein
MATWLQPAARSQSASSKSPRVVVVNRLTSRLTSPRSHTRTHATTVSLCTSNPAHRSWITSIAHTSYHPLARSPLPRTLPTVLSNLAVRCYNPGCSQGFRSNSGTGCEHQEYTDLSAGSVAISSYHVSTVGVCETHSNSGESELVRSSGEGACRRDRCFSVLRLLCRKIKITQSRRRRRRGPVR